MSSSATSNVKADAPCAASPPSPAPTTTEPDVAPPAPPAAQRGATRDDAGNVIDAVCSRCRERKPASAFTPSKLIARSYECRACITTLEREKRALWRSMHPPRERVKLGPISSEPRTERRCGRCKQTKPIAEFSAKCRRCHACSREKNKNWRRRQAEIRDRYGALRSALVSIVGGMGCPADVARALAELGDERLHEALARAGAADAETSPTTTATEVTSPRGAETDGIQELEVSA
eukprot:tig00000042_g15678.t1